MFTHTDDPVCRVIAKLMYLCWTFCLLSRCGTGGVCSLLSVCLGCISSATVERIWLKFCTGTQVCMQWRIQGRWSPLPLCSHRELLDNFCIVYVSLVSRLNRKIRVPRLLVTVRVFCLLKTSLKNALKFIILGTKKWFFFL